MNFGDAVTHAAFTIPGRRGDYPVRYRFQGQQYFGPFWAPESLAELCPPAAEFYPWGAGPTGLNNRYPTRVYEYEIFCEPSPNRLIVLNLRRASVSLYDARGVPATLGGIPQAFEGLDLSGPLRNDCRYAIGEWLGRKSRRGSAE